jgi:hypothetical protein
VVLAAVATEPERAAEKFREFIAQGVHIAERIELWPKPADAT